MADTGDAGREPDLDRIFLALADPTRRMMLLALRERPASVGELVARSTLSQPAISKHLKVLEEAGLVTRRREGQRIFSVLDFAPLVRAAVFVSQFEITVEAQLDRLDSLLSQPPGSTTEPGSDPAGRHEEDPS